MNKRIGIIATVFIASLLIVFGCKKIEQPDMATVNAACDCAKEVSADFLMEEIYCFSCPDNSPSKIYTSTDTIFSNKNVRFRALEIDAEYTWYIGSEILTSSSFARYFGSQWQDSQIPVSLVVKKKPNNICFPHDDGYDSITKFLNVGKQIQDIDSFLLEGTYRMKSPHLVDSFDVVLDIVRGQSTQEPDYIIHLYNLDGQGTNEVDYFNPIYMNYREVKAEGWIWGKFHYRLDNNVFFDFLYQDIQRNYKGRKL